MIRLLILISASSTPQYTPTYTKDIRPIFVNRCSQCHNERVPSLNWLDYNTAYLKRDKIYFKTNIEKTMPPKGFILLDSERDLIRDWYKTGAKK